MVVPSGAVVLFALTVVPETVQNGSLKTVGNDSKFLRACPSLVTVANGMLAGVYIESSAVKNRYSGKPEVS